MDMVLCIALMGGYIYGDIKDYFGGANWGTWGRGDDKWDLF